MSSSIDAVGANSPAFGVTGSGFRNQMQQVMDSVGKRLGMSTDDLQAALKGGQSFSDIAQQKGISQDDLLTAIKQGLQQNAQGAGGATTGGANGSSSLDDLAKKIAGHHRHHGHHHHHGGTVGGMTATETQPAAGPDLPPGGQSLNILA